MSRQDPIAIVSTYYPPVLGGVETSAAGIARFLVRRGHAVHVFTKRTALDVPAEETIDGVAVHRLPPVGPRRGSGKWLVLRTLGGALRRMQPPPRAIYCVDYRGVGLAALSAGRALGVPVLFQAGTDGVLGASASVDATRGAATRAVHRLARAPLSAAYRRADRFICISRDIERETLAAGVPRDRVVYLPHPVRCADFAPVDAAARARLRADLGLHPTRLIVVSVGRLSREKGTFDLAEAWGRLAPAEADLVIVGPDEPGHPWDAGALTRASMGVAIPAPGSSGPPAPKRAIKFVGAQPIDRVAAYLRAADFAVQPSHFEAFGIAALEAMAAGLPVVASDVGGLKDFVEPNVNGILVPPRSPGALSAGIRQLLADEPLRRRLAAGALATSARFDEPLILARLSEIIETLAASR